MGGSCSTGGVSTGGIITVGAGVELGGAGGCGLGAAGAAAVAAAAKAAAAKAAAATPRVLQTGGHTISDAVRKALGLTKDQAKRAMEAMRKAAGQGNADHGHKIFDNGDVYDAAGKFIGNLKDPI